MAVVPPRLRVLYFGSTSRFSQLAFEQLAASQEVVALVLPRPAKSGMRFALRRVTGLHSASLLERLARARGIPVIFASGDLTGRIGERLRVLHPDLICIALFPRLLPRELTALAPLGAINVHPSLLPRHRGPLPLFWTYQSDDRVTGVTVHHASERFDAGDVILQEALELSRGYPVADLDRDLAERAAPLLRAAVELLAQGRSQRIAQDESAATHAPLVKTGAPMVAFDAWDVERVWHFLAGLCPRYREPLADDGGNDVSYDRVTGYRRDASRMAPGSAVRRAGGWTLHCLNGVVGLEASMGSQPGNGHRARN